MTPRERAAYNAGIEAVRQAALIITSMIEAQDGSQGPRQQAAVAALQALAEGAKDLLFETTAGSNHCIPTDQNSGLEAETGRGAGP